MNPTHTATSRSGKRTHLTDASGRSACSRRFQHPEAIAGTFAADEPWCAPCLQSLVDDATSMISSFGVGGLNREEAAFGRLWDAHAEIAVGQFIADYLSEHPPPADATFDGDLADWSERLMAAGEARKRSAGAS